MPTDAVPSDAPRIRPRKDRSGFATGETEIVIGPDGDETFIALVYDGIPPPWSPGMLAHASRLYALVQEADETIRCRCTKSLRCLACRCRETLDSINEANEALEQ